jgi:peptidoglycan/LPS O-acetylase OafA/YrhL
MFPMLFVGWTLNYEMLFYAASALALWRFRRHVPLVFAAITLLLATLFLITSLAHSNRALVEFLAYDRLLEFPLGIAVWFAWKTGVRIPVALAAPGAVAMYVLMTCIERAWPDVSPVVGLGVPTSLLLLSTLSLEGLVVDSALTRGLLYLGDASYATYLSHPFVVEGMRKLVPKVVHGFDVRSPGGVILATVVASVVGCVVYRYVDKPLQRAMRRLINVKRVVNAPAGEEAPCRVR